MRSISTTELRLIVIMRPMRLSTASSLPVGGGSNLRWLCAYRRFEHLFESDAPVTNPRLDDET